MTDQKVLDDCDPDCPVAKIGCPLGRLREESAPLVMTWRLIQWCTVRVLR